MMLDPHKAVRYHFTERKAGQHKGEGLHAYTEKLFDLEVLTLVADI